MAKKSITGGASFQSILLQSDSTQIENIGIAIYQMHRYYSGEVTWMFLSKLNPFLVSGVVKDHVIEYFLNNIIGNKDKLKVRILYQGAWFHCTRDPRTKTNPKIFRNLGVVPTRISKEFEI